MAPLYIALLLCFLSYAAEKPVKYTAPPEKAEDPESMVVLDPARPWDVVSVKERDRLRKLNGPGKVDTNL